MNQTSAKYQHLTTSLRSVADLVADQLDYIRGLSGTNAKGTQLKRLFKEPNNKYADLFEILKFVYDPRITTNVTYVSLNDVSAAVVDYDITLGQYLTILEKCTGSHQDTSEILGHIMRLPLGSREQDLAYQIVTKNLGIGMQAKSINKALGTKLCYDFNLYKGTALPTDPEKLEKRFKNKAIIVTDKLDGFRKELIEGEFYSPNGLAEPMEDYPELAAELALLDTENLVFAGEIIAIGGEDRISRYTLTSSICRRDVDKHGPKVGVEYHIFDMLPLEEFEAGISKKIAVERKAAVKRMIEEHDFKFVKYVEPLYIGIDLNKIDECFNTAMQKDLEGVMVNTADGYYETKKVTTTLFKRKVRKTADLKVVGFEEGKPDGQHVGTLGAILVEYCGRTQRVGGGFKTNYSDKHPDDNVRDYIWQNRNMLLGKIVQVEFDDYINAKEERGLRQPVFIDWRHDKRYPSYL